MMNSVVTDANANLSSYEDYRHFLRERFLAMKKENPSFSYQYCARKLLVTKTHAYNIINGKRHAKLEQIVRLLELFRVPDTHKDHFVGLYLRSCVKEREAQAFFEAFMQRLQPVSN